MIVKIWFSFGVHQYFVIVQCTVHKISMKTPKHNFLGLVFSESMYCWFNNCMRNLVHDLGQSMLSLSIWSWCTPLYTDKIIFWYCLFWMPFLCIRYFHKYFPVKVIPILFPFAVNRYIKINYCCLFAFSARFHYFSCGIWILSNLLGLTFLFLSMISVSSLAWLKFCCQKCHFSHFFQHIWHEFNWVL